MSVRVLDIRAASEFLSLSPRTIRANITSIPHFLSPNGGKYLFRSDELLAWLERFRVKPVDISAAHAIADALTFVSRRRPVPSFSTSSPPSTPSRSSSSPVVGGGGAGRPR